MASSKKIFIYRDEDISKENYEESQSNWLDENEPDKAIIGGEEEGVLLINEEDNSLICMEYTNV